MCYSCVAANINQCSSRSLTFQKVRKLRPETKTAILAFLKNEGNAHHEGARYLIIEFYMEIDAAVDRWHTSSTTLNRFHVWIQVSNSNLKNVWNSILKLSLKSSLNSSLNLSLKFLLNISYELKFENRFEIKFEIKFEAKLEIKIGF